MMKNYIENGVLFAVTPSKQLEIEEDLLSY